ncbi:NEDD4 family-interacting protein 1-like [Saccostrea echinata]|uniref:NEDD4 family-interacting protein 1-like n=1 Tax=Saccostrea echinata TaxID=191078 RepID=UPI002A80FEB0|nr:NEDD4 family-interacting protein 1-like [Saccostrea echinata]
MDRNSIRYEVLRENEVNAPAEPVNLVMIVPPPEYPGNASCNAESSTQKLPSYTEATTLPTYEEAERSKFQESMRAADRSQNSHEEITPHEGRFFKATTLGTDGMFLCAFVMAFFFNWIGFLCSICLFNTIAGRCGALSGLGLSIVKWIFIVKHNKWASDWADGDSWVWWLLLLCGMLIFLRGAIHYIKTKYEWNQIQNSLRNRNLFLF